MDSFLSIQGEVVSVVYENPENGYVIARLLVPSEDIFVLPVNQEPIWSKCLKNNLLS